MNKDFGTWHANERAGEPSINVGITSSCSACSDRLQCAHHLFCKRPAFWRLAQTVERPLFGLVVKAYVAGVVQAMQETGLLYTDHGGSVMRVYASYGAWNLCKTASHFDVARVFPSQFYTFHRTQMQRRCGCLSIKQFVAVVLFPRLLSHGKVAHAVLGGWSLGSVFAFHSALGLEACISGPRAVFAFDARQLPPMHVVGSRLSPGQFNSISREDTATFAKSTHSLINLFFSEAANCRFCVPSLHFTCPSTAQMHSWQDDCVRRARCELYIMAGGTCHFPDAAHNTMAVDHHWDIARRLRGHIEDASDSKVDAFASTLLHGRSDRRRSRSKRRKKQKERLTDVLARNF